MESLTKEQRRDLIEEISNSKNPGEVKEILNKVKEYSLTGKILGIAFEKIYVKKNGYSIEVPMSELLKLHGSFKTTNGGDWCRDNVSYLGRKYYLDRGKDDKHKISSVRCDGLNKSNKIKQDINKNIFKEIKKSNCVILDIGTNIECDHKDGMKNDHRLNDISKQKIEDFQPLCKTANIAKRTHCKQCQATHKRYDARILGYSKAFTYGNENSKTCVGCYWYDPFEFNKTISEDFVKKDE